MKPKSKEAGKKLKGRKSKIEKAMGTSPVKTIVS